jgi:hypothetical protein
MNQSKQPEALRLAQEFEDCVKVDAIPSINDIVEAAAELRRLHQHELAQIEWLEKTEWVQKSARPSELGKHRADVISARIAEKDAEICRLHARVQEIESAQAQRMPLSDAAIRDLYSEEVHWDMVAPYVIAFARSIEAAHGITQEKQG